MACSDPLWPIGELGGACVPRIGGNGGPTGPFAMEVNLNGTIMWRWASQIDLGQSMWGPLGTYVKTFSY